MVVVAGISVFRGREPVAAPVARASDEVVIGRPGSAS